MRLGLTLILTLSIASVSPQWLNGRILPVTRSFPVMHILNPWSSHKFFGGRQYVLSWKEGENFLTFDEARQFCASKNMRVISMDTSNQKTLSFLGHMATNDHVRSIWTSGRLSHDKQQVFWSDSVEPVTQGEGAWSHTGPKDQPQPNDDYGDEDCVAILNNEYSDGIKLHDLQCSRDFSPTVCEDTNKERWHKWAWYG